jgi:hypothetical protein
VLRQRGNTFLEREDDPMRHVLSFGIDVVMDALRAQEAAAKAERGLIRRAFTEREVQIDSLERIAVVVRRAVERGEKRALLLQSPSEWLPDLGRGLTSHDPNWHKRLEGFPRRAYDYCLKERAPRGFQ